MAVIYYFNAPSDSPHAIAHSTPILVTIQQDRTSCQT